LFEDCSIRTEELYRVELGGFLLVPEADSVLLAGGLRVGVVSTKGESRAGEGGLLYGGKDGIVRPGLSGDGILQPVQGVVTLPFSTEG
jgi:hypothetical protein